MRQCLVVFASCLLVAACDDAGGQVADATGAPQDGADGADATTATSEDAAPESTPPLDTALPDLGEVDQNRDLRNGSIVRVGHVTDGDTLEVWVGTLAPKSYVIRMKGLSSPECFKDQRQTPDGNKYVCTADDELYGLQSYVTLKALIEGKTVRVTCDVATGAWCDQDTFDRYLAYLEYEGKDAATEMARAGAGFSYTDFSSSKRAQICQAEYEARNAARGIWALGSVEQIMAQMNSSTAGWYKKHDARCDAAIGGN